MIHPTAIVDPKAEIDSDVQIGPYAVIAPDVQIEAGTVVGPHVTIDQYTTIGPDCQVFQHAAIGAVPQALKFKGEKTVVKIGRGTTIREFVTIHRGTEFGGGITEIGEENCTKVGAAAERAGMVAIFHNHMQYAKEDFDVDALLALSPANRLNFDIGHYYGSTGKDPAAFIEKYHEQIASIHLKDKTGASNETRNNANQVWGQGETPVAEVLQLIQKNQWPIYCDIELEYKIAPWSNAVKEVKLCREFCRQILL